jgi:hypothetical protein
MSDKHIYRFPPGWLVIALLVASGVLWAVLFFVTLPHLRHLAGGAAPFDVRPSGYDYEEAHAFLAAIGAQGRAYYLNPELLLDTFFPPLYAVSRALALWWLTMPGRLRDGAILSGWRRTLIALPVVEAILDWGENACIAAMVWTWPDLSPGLVAVSSLATQLKLVAAALTEISMVVLAAAAMLRWRKLRRA